MTPSRSSSRLGADLRAALGNDQVLLVEDDLAPYGMDATPLYRGTADAVVLPHTTDEVAAALRIAARHRSPVIPRGAGTNLAAGAVPLTGGVVLVLTRMDRILEISPAELLARVQPGVVTADLAAAAADQGLMYAPDPASAATSTVGGNLACSAGGLRGLKYGTARDHVLGLQVVLATGEVIRTGGRLHKDVAGYDLTRLLVGSEGTLAVITEATVALRPLPETSAVGLAYFVDLQAASEAVARIISAGVLPGTLEILDGACLDALRDEPSVALNGSAGALLLFGDDGTRESVDRSLQRMADECLRAGATSVDATGDTARSEALFAARRRVLPAVTSRGPAFILGDVTVPRPRLAEMVSAIQDIARRHDTWIATFGHAGDGNLHPTAVFDDGDPRAVRHARAAFTDIYRTALTLGGALSGEHGIGAAKLPYLPEQLGDAQLALLSRVKDAFDPGGLLNPGKLGSRGPW